MNPRTDCSHFTGVKPCGKNDLCDIHCTQFKKRGAQILFVHLGALGAVVRSTALLKAIGRKYPDSQITWVTEKPADQLLKNHPDIFRILSLSEKDLLSLSVLKFDVAFVIDKSLEATGVLKRTSAKKIFGFVAGEDGVVRNHNAKASELWHLGLSNHLKFNVNKKTEIQLITEALELEYRKDDYFLPLTLEEKDILFQRRKTWSGNSRHVIIGLNTGCAPTIQAKKLSVENHRELIRRLQKNQLLKIVLLGGNEDTLRNSQIAEGFQNVTISPTTLGIRDGLVSVAACDVIITGDSLGMHMAISQKKQVIAWFGPTCAHEIELYGRGTKIITQAPCSPCWKRSCHKPVMCYDLVNLDEIIHAVQNSIHELGYTDSLPGGSSLSDSAFDLGQSL